MQSEDQILDAITDTPQPSSAESKSSLIEAHHNMDHSMPAVPQEYNIRENVYFFLPPEDEVSDTVENTDNPRASTTESGPTPVEEKQNEAEAAPSMPQTYPQEYNIRENVYFFLPPEDEVSDTVENTDNPRASTTESGSTSVEEKPNTTEAGPSVPQAYPQTYDIRENVYFFLPPEDDVSDTVGNTENSRVSVTEPGSTPIEENHDANDGEPSVSLEDDVSDAMGNTDLIPPVPQNLNNKENAVQVEVSDTVMGSNSDQPTNGTGSERESCGQESHNMDCTIPPASQNSNPQKNVVSPEEGYDIMKNVYFFIPKEDDVSDKVARSNSSPLDDSASFERESCEKEKTIGASIEDSPDNSSNEMASRSGTVVISPSNLEGQEQLRTAVWAARNAPYKVNHSRNVSSATTGTSSSLDELKSEPSVTSLGIGEGETDLAGNSANTELFKADEENITPSAPVETSHEDSSQQKEETKNFVYNFGTATVWAGKQGFEVGKAAAIVMLIPADLALKATVSSFKATKTSFLIGRWACARFGPRWLGRLIGA